MPVIDSVLLKGAWYSLEQCGRLLQAAAALYKAKDHSTAVGIAMLAREELGKHRILLNEWSKSIQSGTSPSVEQIRELCGDHVEKQKQGQLSVSLLEEGHSRLATAMRTELTGTPGQPDYQKAGKVIQSAVEAKAKRTPEDRHEKRLEGFFVDVDDSGTDWKRPLKTISSAEALRALNEANNDYTVQRDRFSNTSLLEDAKLAGALHSWSDKPPLPTVTWTL